MSLYLGSSERLKVVLNNTTYYLIMPMINSVRLLSNDGYVLKDFNGLYLTAKEDE